MRPKQPKMTGEGDLFRARLEQIINLKHELVQLAAKIDWDWIDDEIAPLYSDKGRPGIESRFVIGLLLLKHIYGLSDEGVCERWVYDPYFQHFTGEEFFQHQFPHERSDLSHWRKRLGDKLELLLAESLRVAHQSGALRTKDLARVTVDTTVQPKAVPDAGDRCDLLLHRPDLRAEVRVGGAAVAAQRPAVQDLHHLGDLFLADQLNARSGHAGLPPVSLPCATDCTGPAQHDNLTVNTRLGRMEGQPDVSDLLERVAGAPITWGVELGPAATIAKQGITVESFPLGTVITVTLNPLRNGKTFGAMAQGARLIRCGTEVPAGSEIQCDSGWSAAGAVARATAQPSSSTAPSAGVAPVVWQSTTSTSRLVSGAGAEDIVQLQARPGGGERRPGSRAEV